MYQTVRMLVSVNSRFVPNNLKTLLHASLSIKCTNLFAAVDILTTVDNVFDIIPVFARVFLTESHL